MTTENDIFDPKYSSSEFTIGNIAYFVDYVVNYELIEDEVPVYTGNDIVSETIDVKAVKDIEVTRVSSCRIEEDTYIERIMDSISESEMSEITKMIHIEEVINNPQYI
jgi:hypothetical protein